MSENEIEQNEEREQIVKDLIYKIDNEIVPDYRENVESKKHIEKELVLQLALKKLTVKQRDAIFLKIWKHMSEAQIAKFLKISQAAVSKNLSRGLQKLCKIIMGKKIKSKEISALTRGGHMAHYLLINDLLNRDILEMPYSIVILERERLDLVDKFHNVVFERDNKRCVMCGDGDNNRLYCHCMSESLPKQTKNSCILCHSCHMYVHNLAILSNAEREIFNGVIKTSREKNNYFPNSEK